jgi:hypothetical protein
MPNFIVVCFFPLAMYRVGVRRWKQLFVSFISKALTVVDCALPWFLVETVTALCGHVFRCRSILLWNYVCHHQA